MKKLFHNIEISPIISIHGNPIQGVNHCAGPIWPDFNNAGFVRHHWGSGRGSVDIEPSSQGDIATHLKGLYIYGGCIYPHFGHFIAEFTSRLFPAVLEHPDAGVIYVSRDSSIPDFISQIFSLFGISERILIVYQPVILEKLIVYKQAEVWGYSPHPELTYLEMLSSSLSRAGICSAVNKNKYLFVSRANMAAGRFIAENYLERCFAELGFRIFRPEEHSLADQVQTYLNFENIIFSEGSAAHCLQLMGKIDANIIVLSRRSNTKQFPDDFLKSRVKNLKYFDVMLVKIGAASDSGEQLNFTDIVLLDIQDLLYLISNEFHLPVKQVIESHHSNLKNYSELVYGDIKRILSLWSKADIFSNRESQKRVCYGLLALPCLNFSQKIYLIREFFYSNKDFLCFLISIFTPNFIKKFVNFFI
jgi:hypothetical protein